MPTLKREWYRGESYHVTARGNHRNDIFKEEEDFIYYRICAESPVLEVWDG